MMKIYQIVYLLLSVSGITDSHAILWNTLVVIKQGVVFVKNSATTLSRGVRWTYREVKDYNTAAHSLVKDTRDHPVEAALGMFAMGILWKNHKNLASLITILLAYRYKQHVVRNKRRKSRRFVPQSYIYDGTKLVCIKKDHNQDDTSL